MDSPDAPPEFDTLAVVRKLRAADVGGKQAEAHAEIHCDIRAGLATGADIRRLEAKMATKTDPVALENRMLRVALAVVFAQTALTAALTAGLTFGLLKMFGGAP